jgi:hypothetical protein
MRQREGECGFVSCRTAHAGTTEQLNEVVLSPGTRIRRFAAELDGATEAMIWFLFLPNLFSKGQKVCVRHAAPFLRRAHTAVHIGRGSESRENVAVKPRHEMVGTIARSAQRCRTMAAPTARMPSAKVHGPSEGALRATIEREQGGLVRSCCRHRHAYLAFLTRGSVTTQQRSVTPTTEIRGSCQRVCGPATTGYCNVRCNVFFPLFSHVLKFYLHSKKTLRVT